MYKDEKAALNMAVKRTRKAGSPEAGFRYLQKWTGKHTTRNGKQLVRIFRKWMEKEFYAV